MKSDGGISFVVQLFDIKSNFHIMLKNREELKVSENVVGAENIYKNHNSLVLFLFFFNGQTRLPEANLEEVQL